MLGWLPAVRGKLDVLCAEYSVPIGFVCGWIQEESAGHITSTTSLDERGMFQLLPEESADLRLDHERLSVDMDYSLEAGFILIDHYESVVDAFAIEGLTHTDDLFWHLVKFAHSIGSGAARYIVRGARTAGAMANWSDFSAYCGRHEADIFAAVKHSPVKWVKMVDAVFTVAALVTPDDSPTNPPDQAA